MSSIAARVVDTHASAQQAVGHLFGHGAALPNNFDSFTAVQVHDHFLQHGVECTLDFAAQVQRDFIAHKLEHNGSGHHHPASVGNAARPAASPVLPPSGLPMRDQYMDPWGPMYLKSACGNVRQGLNPQYAERAGTAPIGAWWSSETRRDSDGQTWIKHTPGEYFVVNDFGHLVAVTGWDGGAA